jgi:hypothetical protein
MSLFGSHPLRLTRRTYSAREYPLRSGAIVSRTLCIDFWFPDSAIPLLGLKCCGT